MVCGIDSMFGRCRGDTLEISSHGEETHSHSGSDRGLDTEASVMSTDRDQAVMLNTVVSPLVDTGSVNGCDPVANHHVSATNNHHQIHIQHGEKMKPSISEIRRKRLPSPSKWVYIKSLTS